jgi:hypothetical protein
MTVAPRAVSRLTMVAFLALGCDARLFAGRVTAPCVADTWVASEGAGGERGALHGQDTTLVVSGLRSFALLQFDLAAARGLTVDKAVLRIHRRPDPVPLHTVGLSTISGSGAWSEGHSQFTRAGASVGVCGLRPHGCHVQHGRKPVRLHAGAGRRRRVV